MVRPWTHDGLVFLLGLLRTVWSLFYRPERCLRVVLLFGIDLVLASWLVFQLRFSVLLLTFLEFPPHVKICEVLVFLEHIELLGFVDQLRLLLYLLFSQLLLFVLFVFELFLFLLFDQVLEDAFLAEDVSLITNHWLDDTMCANCAHVEWLLGILADPLFNRPI